MIHREPTGLILRIPIDINVWECKVCKWSKYSSNNITVRDNVQKM